MEDFIKIKQEDFVKMMHSHFDVLIHKTIKNVALTYNGNAKFYCIELECDSGYTYLITIGYMGTNFIGDKPVKPIIKLIKTSELNEQRKIKDNKNKSDA